MTASQRLQINIAGHLEKIAKFFVNPKITIVIRAAHLDDGDVILTDDDLDEAIAAIERLKSRDVVKPATEADIIKDFLAGGAS